MTHYASFQLFSNLLADSLYEEFALGVNNKFLSYHKQLSQIDWKNIDNGIWKPLDVDACKKILLNLDRIEDIINNLIDKQVDKVLIQ